MLYIPETLDRNENFFLQYYFSNVAAVFKIFSLRDTN